MRSSVATFVWGMGLFVGTVGAGCDNGDSDDPVGEDPGAVGGGEGSGNGEGGIPAPFIPQGPGPGGACTSIDFTGAPFVRDEVAGGLPTLTGGAIADGTYMLQQYVWYSTSNTRHTRRMVFQVSDGGTRGQYLWHRNNEPEQRYSVAIATSGDLIAIQTTCPSVSTLEWDRYSVSGNQLILHSTGDAKTATLVRQ